MTEIFKVSKVVPLHKGTKEHRFIRSISKQKHSSFLRSIYTCSKHSSDKSKNVSNKNIANTELAKIDIKKL